MSKQKSIDKYEFDNKLENKLELKAMTNNCIECYLVYKK